MTTIPETTQYFQKPGRTPPARLHVVPNPFEEERTACIRPTGKATWNDILAMRGELPAPKSTRGRSRKAAPAPVALWNRKGFVYPDPEDHQGKLARVHRSAQEGLERIRSTPKNLAALLKTAEWKGARVVGTVASPEIGLAEQDVSASAGRVAESEREIRELTERLSAQDLGDKVRKTIEINMGTARAALAQRQTTLEDARKRLNAVRSEEWIRVVHPSGAELKIRPQWGE